MTVTMYTKPGCVQCNASYRKLAQKGIAVEAIDVSVDEAALELVRNLGYSQVPVIVAGDMHWSGYRPDLIEGLLLAA